MRSRGPTYPPTVSESPIIVKERRGRVIATSENSISSCLLFELFCYTEALRQRHSEEGIDWGKIWGIPFSLRFSPRNPTSRSELLRTRETITASFSRP